MITITSPFISSSIRCLLYPLAKRFHVDVTILVRFVKELKEQTKFTNYYQIISTQPTNVKLQREFSEPIFYLETIVRIN